MSRKVVRSRSLAAVAVLLTTLGCAPPSPRNAAQQTESMRRTVQVGAPVNATISYLSAGDVRGPRLVLVHGTPGSATAWTDYLIEPPAGLEVLALDRPGFGLSGPEGAVTSLAAQAAAVVAMLPTDGRKAILLGHSLGGPIVAWVAAEHPQRVRAVILLAASLDPALETIHPMQPVAATRLVRSVLPRAIRNANAELMDLKPELDKLALLLPRVKAPVLIVHGVLDDLVPVANVPYMQARLTGSACLKTTLLQGRNHFLPWNSEPDVRAALQQALQWAEGAPC